MIARIQHHQELAYLFVLHFHDGQVTVAGVNFTLTLETISQATGITKRVNNGTKENRWIECIMNHTSGLAM